MVVKKAIYILLLFIMVVFSTCSSSSQLTVPEAESGQSVRIILNNGNALKGMILAKDKNELVLVAESDHESHELKLTDIRRIEKIDEYYDLQAYSISMAEIEKYKTNRNTLGYALGGAAIGGAGGLVLGFPFWAADVGDIPPYFVAGAGAVVGSIYFAFRGQDKDKKIALEKIRYLRKAERELEQQVDKEKDELQKLNEEKERLQQELKKDKQQQDDSDK